MNGFQQGAWRLPFSTITAHAHPIVQVDTVEWLMALMESKEENELHFRVQSSPHTLPSLRRGELTKIPSKCFFSTGSMVVSVRAFRRLQRIQNEGPAIQGGVSRMLV